jgi:hypothetical protein
MRSFKHHLLSVQQLDALRFDAAPKTVIRRLDEGLSKFEIDISDLFVDTPPTNSSKRSKYELEELAKLAKPGFYSGLVELPVMEIVQVILDEHNLHLPDPSRKRMVSVLHDVRTACLALQYEYRRIRPRTLAEHYGISLPDTYKNQDSTPSYPSIRSTQMSFLTLYLGERFTKIEDDMYRLSEETDAALMASALHYRSDIEASHELARYLFSVLKRKL